MSNVRGTDVPKGSYLLSCKFSRKQFHQRQKWISFYLSQLKLSAQGSLRKNRTVKNRISFCLLSERWLALNTVLRKLSSASVYCAPNGKEGGYSSYMQYCSHRLFTSVRRRPVKGFSIASGSPTNIITAYERKLTLRTLLLTSLWIRLGSDLRSTTF